MGGSGIVCLTKRDLRYQAKKRGYHGGACVQEVVIPFAALRHVATVMPETWQDLPPFQPTWWDITWLSITLSLAGGSACLGSVIRGLNADAALDHLLGNCTAPSGTTSTATESVYSPLPSRTPRMGLTSL